MSLSVRGLVMPSARLVKVTSSLFSARQARQKKDCRLMNVRLSVWHVPGCSTRPALGMLCIVFMLK